MVWVGDEADPSLCPNMIDVYLGVNILFVLRNNYGRIGLESNVVVESGGNFQPSKPSSLARRLE
jgi:hypothetical protein